MRQPISPEFAALFRKALDEHSLGIRELAELSGFSAGFLSHVGKARRLPQVHQAAKIAECIRLSGEELDLFMLEAKLAHCPPDIAAVVRRLVSLRDQQLELNPTVEEVGKVRQVSSHRSPADLFGDLLGRIQAREQRIADLEQQVSMLQKRLPTDGTQAKKDENAGGQPT